MLVSVFYLFSLFSSSFIEEEHEIWYFFEATQFFLVIIAVFKSLKQTKDFVLIIILMVLVRFLRTINRTGNKWIHLKDFGDHLKELETKIPLILAAMLSLGVVCSLQNNSIQNKKSRLINLFNCLIIFAYHLSFIYSDFFDLSTRNTIAQLTYMFLLASLSFNLFNCNQSHLAFGFIANHWLLLNCLIHPTQNLIVLAIWQTKEFILKRYLIMICSELKETICIMCFYFVISQSCYFSQGNSNSLNTVQVSSGFVGINEMNIVIVGILLISATYSSSIYWFLCSVRHLLQINNSNRYIFIQQLFF